MLDLEFVQASIDRWNGLNTEDANALVAELRAAQGLARHVLDFLDELDLDDEYLIDDAKSLRAKAREIANYQKVTGESQ